MGLHLSYCPVAATPLPLVVGYPFLVGLNILLPMVASSCNFGVLAGEDCVDHKKTVENSKTHGNTRPSYLSAEKPVHRSRSESEPYVEQLTGSKLGKEYTVTLFIYLICRVHHVKCWAG